jgi:hypothetical protein
MFGAATFGALVLAVPAQAHDDRDYHRDHHRHWRDHGSTVVVEPSPAYGNSDVTVAFGGHARRHHHFHHRVIREDIRER